MFSLTSLQVRESFLFRHLCHQGWEGSNGLQSSQAEKPLVLPVSAHLPGLVWSAKLGESLSEELQTVLVFLVSVSVDLNLKVYQYRPL